MSLRPPVQPKDPILARIVRDIYDKLSGRTITPSEGQTVHTRYMTGSGGGGFRTQVTNSVFSDMAEDTLYFPKGEYSVNGDTVMTPNLLFDAGAKVKVYATLRVRGGLLNAPIGLFDIKGEGKVILEEGEVNAGWFYQGDMAEAVRQASLAASEWRLLKNTDGRKIKIPAGRWPVKKPIPAVGLHLSGQSADGTTLLVQYTVPSTPDFAEGFTRAVLSQVTQRNETDYQTEDGGKTEWSDFSIVFDDTTPIPPGHVRPNGLDLFGDNHFVNRVRIIGMHHGVIGFYTIMTRVQQVQVFFSRGRGFWTKLRSNSDIGTSVVFEQCWSYMSALSGIRIEGMAYGALRNCATQQCGYGGTGDDEYGQVYVGQLLLEGPLTTINIDHVATEGDKRGILLKNVRRVTLNTPKYVWGGSAYRTEDESSWEVWNGTAWVSADNPNLPEFIPAQGGPTAHDYYSVQGPRGNLVTMDNASCLIVNFSTSPPVDGVISGSSGAFTESRLTADIGFVRDGSGLPKFSTSGDGAICLVNSNVTIGRQAGDTELRFVRAFSLVSSTLMNVDTRALIDRFAPAYWPVSMAAPQQHKFLHMESQESDGNTRKGIFHGETGSATLEFGGRYAGELQSDWAAGSSTGLYEGGFFVSSRPRGATEDRRFPFVLVRNDVRDLALFGNPLWNDAFAPAAGATLGVKDKMYVTDNTNTAIITGHGIDKIQDGIVTRNKTAFQNSDVAFTQNNWDGYLEMKRADGTTVHVPYLLPT